MFYGPETSKNNSLSLLVSVYIYTTYFQPVGNACCSRFCVLMQFPIATSWTKRDFSVDRLLWKVSILLFFSTIYFCRSLRKMLHICSWARSVSQWGKSAGGGGGGTGESRLLHISVAMGILVQWLCSNAAAGMEDLFLPGRKKKCVHELKSKPPIMWQGHLF